MTVTVHVDCPNEECIEMPEYTCEGEDAGEGSEHEVTCKCGTRISFNIEYFPSAMGEEIIEQGS